MSSIKYFLFKQRISQSECEAQIKIFDDVSGPVEAKYSEFTVAWTNIESSIKSFIDKSFPVHCFPDEETRDIIFGDDLRFLHVQATISEKEYLSYTDPKNINQITAKASEIDACYESSRNLVGVDIDETEINFCRYLNLNLRFSFLL